MLLLQMPTQESKDEKKEGESMSDPYAEGYDDATKEWKPRALEAEADVESLTVAYNNMASEAMKLKKELAELEDHRKFFRDKLKGMTTERDQLQAAFREQLKRAVRMGNEAQGLREALEYAIDLLSEHLTSTMFWRPR